MTRRFLSIYGWMLLVDKEKMDLPDDDFIDISWQLLGFDSYKGEDGWDQVAASKGAGSDNTNRW